MKDTNISLIDNTQILLYITTHFSDQHVRYFRCCWPKLVQQSPLISRAHILIAATNSSEIPMHELQYLESLFSNNPSYTFKPLPENFDHKCAKYKDAFNNRLKKSDNPLKVPVNLKQCLANQGVQAGVKLGWVFNSTQSHDRAVVVYDWMIRINPDVLIRKASWFLETMANSTIQGIFVDCNKRQLHTDFFAVRPSALSPDAFSTMGVKANKLNHERTAYREFKHILEDGSSYRFVPDVEPSQGSCRVRGNGASVYHAHDSCIESQDGSDLVCDSLEGWDLGN
jgi:hypothetical protein